jgi:hypothetical protein
VSGQLLNLVPAAADASEHGHTTVTPPEKLGATSENRRAPDKLSLVRAIQPRLLSLEEAAHYLNLSFWSFRELVNAGDVPLIRIPRPQTLRQRKRLNRGQVKGGNLRRALVDVRDLDRLVDRWREAAVTA